MATPQALIDEASCLSCTVPPGLAQYIIIAQLQKLNGTSMTPQELIDLASCTRCQIPAGLAPYISLALLDQIAEAGGGGGGTGGVLCGTSDPVAAPEAGCTLFYRTDVVRVLSWNGSAWVVQLSEI